ncbi:hypothetical protein QBC43DRAFT_212894 [Cladorrhinum sp. PSN259]|nr:hypothetical protein QBC43DRAFT_212894 [Cladorrhinum sp. PSN259]
MDAAINNKRPQATSTAIHPTCMHDEPAPVRRRTISGISGFDAPDENHRLRRSSTFSGYSWSEVSRDIHDDILDPGPMLHHDETSWRSSLPLMFAILPATVGLVFKNGSSFITDVILLGLTAVFLHWSVTAPWKWYHSAQQLREENESVVETAYKDDDEDSESRIIDTTSSSSPSPSKPSPQDAESQLKLDRASKAHSALKKLRIHEILALTTCFIVPALATYLLHFIREFLSRPSEGLVSNFNLTIFLLAAEISPVSHSIKLIQSNTLHLQRIVHSHQNPHNKRQEKVTSAQWKNVLARLDELENKQLQQQQTSQHGHTIVGTTSNEQKALHVALVREVRNSVQPEIDALNRAVRRYEKKARVLAVQTESRIRELRTRVDDAVSLSALVLSQRRKSLGGMGVSTVAQQWGGWLVGKVLKFVCLPLRAVVGGFEKVVEGVGWVFGFGSGGTGGAKMKMRQKGKGIDRRVERDGIASGNMSGSGSTA